MSEQQECYEINVSRRWLYLKTDEPEMVSVYEIWIGREYVRGYPTKRQAEDRLVMLNAGLRRKRSDP